MNGGTKYTLIDVDKKGRIHLPQRVRKNLGIEDSVVIEIGRNILIIKPVKKIDDPIEFLSSLKIKTKKSPTEMKREAELIFS